MKAQSEKVKGLKVKIGFDGKRAANNLSGLGNYSRSLIEHLANQFPENEYYVYTTKVNASILKRPLFSKENVKIELPPKNSTSPIWRSVGIVLQLVSDKITLFHGLSHEIPFGLKENGIKSIVTIHDLIFLIKPHYYKFFDRIIYKYKSKYACNHADQIIAISEQTKKDIVHFYQINPTKIDVIYQSCDDQFKKLLGENEKEFIRKKHHLPKKYLLNVGTIEVRKNLLQIIKALPFIEQTYSLVVIGKETTYLTLVKKEIKKLSLHKRIIFLHDIPFSDLPAIYQSSSVFIFPSRYEGFGIPIIEALYGNVPIIAATGSCLEEAGGPDSRYISPDDEESLANAVNEVLCDEDLQQKMKRNGMEYVQRFNNDVISKQIMECYLKTIRT